MTPYNVTIDLETLGTTTNSTILTVGIVKFNPANLVLPFDGIHISLDIKEQKAQGRYISPETIAWWKRQDPKAQEAAFSGERIPVKEALKMIQDYFKVMDSTNPKSDQILISEVWGQGYGFDMTMLGDLFDKNDMEKPWKFYQERDSRTLFSLLSEDPRPAAGKDTLHNALSDAYYQSQGIQIAFDKLRSLKS